MTSFFISTSAEGSMRGNHARETALVGVGFLLLGLGTSTAAGLPGAMVTRGHLHALQTSAGLSLAPVEHPVAAIAELRRRSGLTWEQLAHLFGVSRRALHFWASGKAMTPANAERLQRLLTVIRTTDRGSAGANRAALLAARDDGTALLDLLADAQYERVTTLLGPSNTPRTLAPKLSKEVLAARSPRPPEELVGALHDRVHREIGIARAARSVRVKGGR